MSSEAIFWAVILGLSTAGAHFTAIDNAARDWTRLMFEGMTTSEVMKLDRKAGIQHHLVLSQEETFIRDILLPLSFAFRNGLLFFTALGFIVSGFYWTHWLHPLLAIPGFIVVIPRLLLILLPGRRTGYKKLILRGLAVKIATARKLNDEERANGCSALQVKLQETTWRP